MRIGAANSSSTTCASPSDRRGTIVRIDEYDPEQLEPALARFAELDRAHEPREAAC
ncbi:MAG: hypothetical protein WEF50_09330 [Myxococcota bacterium]